MKSVTDKLFFTEQFVFSSISIVIPVCNTGENFRKCLRSLDEFVPKSIEIIVVVDGGMDDSYKVAEEFGAKVLEFPTTGGPARARNLGACAAQGDIILFIDADVTVCSDTISQILKIFWNQPHIAALIGSYDDMPSATNFLSQYKKLFHHYTHQTASENASIF